MISFDPPTDPEADRTGACADEFAKRPCARCDYPLSPDEWREFDADGTEVVCRDMHACLAEVARHVNYLP